MEIEFQGQYDRATIFRAVAVGNRPSRWSIIVRAALTVIVVGIYASYIFLIAGKDGFSTLEIVRMIRHMFAVPFMAYFLLQPYISSYVTASNLWKSPSMSDPFRGVVSSKGIALNLSSGRREFAWEDFARIRKVDDLIVLLTANGNVAILLRRFFQFDDEWQQILQWVEYRVQEAQ